MIIIFKMTDNQGILKEIIIDNDRKVRSMNPEFTTLNISKHNIADAIKVDNEFQRRVQTRIQSVDCRQNCTIAKNVG